MPDRRLKPADGSTVEQANPATAADARKELAGGLTAGELSSGGEHPCQDIEPPDQIDPQALLTTLVLKMGLLEERLRFETLLGELSAAFANLTSDQIDQEIERWLLRLAELLGVDRATLLTFEAPAVAIHSATVAGVPPLALSSTSERLPWLSNEMRRGNTIKWVNIPDDIPADAHHERAYASEIGMKSVLNLPVLLGGSVVCAMSLTSITSSRDWSEEVIARLRLVGEIFANAYLRKRTEQALRESEERYRTLVEATSVIVWTADAEGGNFSFPGWVELTGQTEEEARSDGWLKVVHPDDRARTMQAWAAALSTQRPCEIDCRVKTRDGQYRHFISRAVPIISKGRVREWVGAISDITESKQAETALRVSAEKFSKAFQSSPAAISITTLAEGRFVEVNAALEKFVGHTREELIGHTTTELGLWEEVGGRQRLIDEIKRVGSVDDWALRFQTKQGKVVVSQSSAEPIEIGGEQCLLSIFSDITERRQAEEALRESEARFRAMFENSGSAMALVDMQGHPVECNPALQRLLGYSEEELRAMPFTDFTHADDRELDWGLYGELAAGQRDRYEIDKRFITKDGRIIWGNLIVSLVRDGEGVPRYAVGMVHDVSERKRADDLRQVSERLKLATIAATIGIWDWDIVNDELVWDDAMYRVYGIRKEAFSGTYAAWVRVLAPEDRERANAAVQAALGGEREFAQEFRIVWPDGSVHFTQAASRTFRDETGHPVRMVGVNYDISERKLAEEKLRWSEEQLRLLLDSTAEGIFGVDSHGECTFCNAATLNLLGYSQPVELLGKDMHVLIAHTRADGSSYPAADCRIVRALQSGASVSGDDDIFWRKDGTTFPAEYWSYPMYREGRPVGAVVTFIDISQRKQSEEALRLSEERFAKAFQASPEPISIYRNSDGILLEVNERWTSVYGYTREEAVGRKAIELTLPSWEDRQALTHLLQQPDGNREVEIDLRTKQGSIRHVSLSTEQIVINGELCNIYLHRDITERRRAEQENRELIHALGERVKELTALHRTARILQQESADVLQIVREIALLLPPAFQYPEITAGRVRLGDTEFATAGFTEELPILRAEFRTMDDQAGSIEVVYTKSCASEAEGPYLTEERALINTLVEMLRTDYDRRRSEEQIRLSSEQLRALLERLRSAREEEGIRIGRELHDELGSALTSLKWSLVELDRVGARGADQPTAAALNQRIQEMVGLIDATINTVRRISSELRPSVLDDLGLISAIEWHSQQFQTRTGIFCQFDSLAETVSLNADQATAAFRIFQESMTNILRHAQATRVDVFLAQEDDEFVLEIRDNGRGIGEQELLGNRSLGLLGMRERAQAVAGTLSIRGIAGRGTSSTLRIHTNRAANLEENEPESRQQEEG